MLKHWRGQLLLVLLVVGGGWGVVDVLLLVVVADISRAFELALVGGNYSAPYNLAGE